LRKFRLVSVSSGVLSTPLNYALAKVPFYKYIPVVVIFLLLIQFYLMTWIKTYCLRYAYIITNVHTFFNVTFDTGTKFPAVSWNSLLAAAIMNVRLCWNWIEVPTQSHPNATSPTLCAWKCLQLMFYFFVCHATLGSMYQPTDTRGVISDVDYPYCFPETPNFLTKSAHSIFPSWCTVLFSTCRNIFNIYDDLKRSYL
jgi:hypothetical protein